METGSADELGVPFDFNFDFCGDDLINNDNMQAHTNQLNETVGNFSNEHFELGSSCGSNSKQNLTAFTHLNSDLLDLSLENAPNFALPETSSFNPALVETPQSYLPTPDFVDQQSADGGNNQPQLERVNTNPNLEGHVDVSSESIDPSLVNAPNLSHIGTSSVNPPSIDTPQPYLPTMSELLESSSLPLQSSTSLEQGELRSSVESSQSFANNSSSSPNIMRSIYVGFEGSNPPLGNATTVQQPRSSFINPPLPRTSYLYPPTTVNMIPQNGVDQSFHPEHAVNLINSNQLNPHSENGLLNQNLLPQRMASFNQGTPVCTDQMIQNFANNNFSNNQQALPYTTSFPQSSMAVGVANVRSSQINQQRSPWVSHYQNSPYRPLTRSGSQPNQFISGNVFDPQITNSRLLGPSAPLRPQQLANQLQPLSQVPEMPNAFDTQSHYSMQPEFSMNPRFQQFTYQPNQVPVAPNGFDPLGRNNMLPEPPTSLRPIQQVPHYNQLNPVSAAPDVLDMQFNNSMQPKASMMSRTQQLSDPVQLNQVPVAPNIMNLQSHNAMLPEPSMPSRPQAAQGLLNQTAIPNASYPSSGLSQRNQVLNSLAQKEIVDLDAAMALSHQLENSSGIAKEGILGPRSRSSVELGELSLPSKRSRRDSIMPPHASSPRQVIGTSQSQEDEPEIADKFIPYDLRPVKNAVYDPIFEGIGLPVDPHLRLFSMN